MDLTPYSWLNDTTSMTVYDYNSSTENHWTSATMNNDYYNIRFFNKPINWSTSSKLRIFRIARNAVGNNSLRSLIPDLQLYDIVILTGEAAYMYVSNEDLQYGV